MNYRHLYHAGSFADVMKHVILIAMLEAMERKETPFCYLDTHAGIGLYPLYSAQSQKRQEYLDGVAKLISLDQKTMPVEIKKYLSIVQQYNSNNKLEIYPGSPKIAEELLRPQDQMILCELHPEDFQTLKDNFRFKQNAVLHHTDGYCGMKAFLPPKQNRALVLIDPPFEVKNEFIPIDAALELALKRFRQGNFMIWYPIKNEPLTKQFHHAIKKYKTEYLMINFYLNNSPDPKRLSACGIVLINPPFKIKELLEKTVLPYLAKALEARFEIFFS